MGKIPNRVEARLSAGLKRFQPILDSARARDVNESDTVVIVTDILAEVLGYDKYTEITSEHMIRSTYCDLAIHLEGQLAVLIEVKAIGADLKEAQTKQAVDYAANKGCEWVALTNGIVWKVYQVIFGKPLIGELIAEADLCRLNPRKEADLEVLWALSKEGWQKSRLSEVAAQQHALNRFTLGAILTGDACVSLLRRELRRLSPDAKIDQEQILNVLTQDVIKREVLEGDKAAAAKKLANRVAARQLRERGAAAASPPAAAPAAGHSGTAAVES